MARYEMYHFGKSIYKKKKMESIPFLDLSEPKIKFIEISTQGSLGIGKDVYNLGGITLDLACLHVMHL
jgi:hypothetical protein